MGCPLTVHILPRQVMLEALDRRFPLHAGHTGPVTGLFLLDEGPCPNQGRRVAPASSSLSLNGDLNQGVTLSLNLTLKPKPSMSLSPSLSLKAQAQI